MIAALYVAIRGCYFGLDGVDPWDVTRDAKVRNRTAGNLLQASREMRSATPVGFRDLLIELATRAVGGSNTRHWH